MIWRRTLRGTALAAVLLAVAFNVWDINVSGLSDRTGRLKCPDFLQFYTYGALARTGHAASLYDGEAHARIAREAVDPRMRLSNFRPDYSPAIAWLMAPLSALPYLHAMLAWTAITVVLFAVSVALLVAACPSAQSDRATVWLLAAAWPTVMVVLRYGQISALSLLLLAAAIALDFRSRRWAAGFALGLLVYKPNLLGVVVLTLAMAREWRLLAGVIAGAALETAAGVLSVGAAVYGQYVAILATVARQPSLIQIYPTESHSAAGAVRLLVSWGPAATIAWAIALVVSTAISARVWTTIDDPRPRWAALVLAMLVASPHLLTYDLLLLAAPILLVADWRWDVTGRRPAGAWMTALVLLYCGAWPGTLLARLYGLQISTIGMGLGLALLFEETQHQLVRGQAEHGVVDGSTA